MTIPDPETLALSYATVDLSAQLIPESELAVMRAFGVDDSVRSRIYDHWLNFALNAQHQIEHPGDAPVPGYAWIAHSIFPEGFDEEHAKRIAERDIETANRDRDELLSVGLIDARDVQAAFNLSEEEFAFSSLIYFFDYNRVLCPTFQFRANLPGLERINILNQFFDFSYPSIEDTQNWFYEIEEFGGESLGQVAQTWPTKGLLAELEQVPKTEDQDIVLSVMKLEIRMRHEMGKLAVTLGKY
jgi:hypothetical protein